MRAVVLCLLLLASCERGRKTEPNKDAAAIPVPVVVDAVTVRAVDAPIDAPIDEPPEPDEPACARTCRKAEQCPSIPCRCEDGTVVNMKSCHDGCCAPEEEACTSACEKHDGPKGTWNEARDGRKTGRACRRDDDCASQICLRGYCSRKCVSFGDCPPFWDCVEGRSAFDKFCQKR